MWEDVEVAKVKSGKCYQQCRTRLERVVNDVPGFQWVVLQRIGEGGLERVGEAWRGWGRIGEA